MTPEELGVAVTDGEIDTVIVGFTDHFGRLMGKRFDARFFVDEVLAAGTHGCDYLLTVDMDMEPVPGYRYANWALGYGDFHLVPDPSTLRLAAWTDGAALVLCDVHGPDHQPVAVAPRSILRRQVALAAAAGLTIMTASELEFFLFEESYRDAAAAGHRELTTAGWYNEDYDLLQGERHEPFVGAARRMLVASGVPVENSKGEAAQGQHELNVRYADALTMADRHAVMKFAMKALADRQGRSLTFMAKPVPGESGNSCHIHLSARNGDGASVFAAGPGDEAGTERFRWFLGGWMRHLAELQVWFAPTINSYKRYVEASWAPTRIAWSRDNRTAGFRVVGAGEGLRIECRIPGGDVNPYLAYAAAIAAGLDGISQRIEPPPAIDGDVYAATEAPRVAGTLREAVAAFDTGPLARASFGDEVVDHYAHHYRTELAAFDAAVTDWERTRYFERI
ncbi:MAG: glutamine synthetase family protein [Actinomycetota bacterium]